MLIVYMIFFTLNALLLIYTIVGSICIYKDKNKGTIFIRLDKSKVVRWLGRIAKIDFVAMIMQIILLIITGVMNI